uniref:Polymerase nucleotidyl transferase domain-containing protein n=1 Tax=Panagrolaimus davidi TaxID=227884 RepID=A0A914P8V4_9BILA
MYGTTSERHSVVRRNYTDPERMLGRRYYSSAGNRNSGRFGRYRNGGGFDRGLNADPYSVVQSKSTDDILAVGKPLFLQGSVKSRIAVPTSDIDIAFSNSEDKNDMKQVYIKPVKDALNRNGIQFTSFLCPHSRSY